MRLKSLILSQVAGLGLIDIADLSDIVVFAGPNGVGKTRIMRQLIQFFQNPQPNDQTKLIVEATNERERKSWGKNLLDTSIQGDANLLRTSLQRNQKRNSYNSTVLNFDSDRAVTQIQPFSFSWDFIDPYEEEVNWGLSYSFLRDRFTDVQHSLFKLVESQRRRISQDAIEVMKGGGKILNLEYPDPIDPFRKAFSQLLAPKILSDLQVKTQQMTYLFEGQEFSLQSLSSGEREVVNIVFDFLLRNPSDCIVFFDEPELHLHPELSYRLLQTLASIGKNNQFIFCTHSPEIITASIENSVIFIKPKVDETSNQAIKVQREDETNHALNLLGQSIGIISLGKKLLLIEGEEASLDKQTYGAILKNEFPELVLVPVGSKDNIRSFGEIQKSVLDKTIWGVEFFMLCDRDAARGFGEFEPQSKLSPRFKILPRYHLENYFLDESVFAQIFEEMEPQGSWLRDNAQIADRIKLFAKLAVPLAVSLRVAAAARFSVGNADVRAKGVGSGCTLVELQDKIRERVAAENTRISASLNPAKLEILANEEFRRLHASLDNGTNEWRNDIPGRILLNQFANAAKIPVGRLKTLYLKKAEIQDVDPFAEIRAIFREFRLLQK